MVESRDTRYLLYPSDQKEASARVILAVAIRENEIGRKDPKKEQAEIMVEIVSSSWFKNKCQEEGLKLGTIRSLGLQVLNFFTG